MDQSETNIDSASCTTMLKHDLRHGHSRYDSTGAFATKLAQYETFAPFLHK
jgi:hypothetical protein